MKKAMIILMMFVAICAQAQQPRLCVPVPADRNLRLAAEPVHVVWSEASSASSDNTTAYTLRHRAPGDYTTEEVNEYGIIMAPAAGEERVYERAGNSLIYNYTTEECVPAQQSGALTLVETTDGTVYMKQPVSCYGFSYAGDSWIKGKREGNKLVFAGSQKVNYTSAFGMDASMSVCRGVYGAKYEKGYGPDREATIVFSETSDGYQLFLDGTDSQHIIGVFWDDDDSFTGYGDYDTELALNTEGYEEPLVTPPAGLVTTDLIIEANDYRTGEKISQWCTMGFDGDDVYLTGFSFSMPETWIKGTRDGNRLTFPREQYVGKDAGYEMYVYGGYLTDSGAAISDLYFIYNEAKQTYTSPSGLLLTRGKVTSQIVLAEYLSAISIHPEGIGGKVDVNIRYDVPEGTLQTYSRTGASYYTFFGYILDGRQEGKHLDVVYGDVDAAGRQKVFMMNPISQASTDPGSWIEGYISPDDHRIHMPLGQFTYQDPDSGLAMQTAVLRLTVSGDPMSPLLDFVYDDRFSEVTFTIGDDGSLTLDPMTSEIIYEGYPSMVYGLIYDDDYTWTGYADYETRYLPFASSVTTIPAGLKAETWAYMYSDGTNDVASEVRVATDSKTMYIAGLNENAPAAAIVGSIEGDRVTFASDQYVGNSAYDIFLYFVAAEYTNHEAYDEEFDYHYTYRTYEYLPSITLSYDAAARRLTSTSPVAIVVNQGQGSTGVFTPTAVGLEPSFVGFDETAATPATPSVVDYGFYYDDYGYDVAEFYVPTLDTEGRYMRTDKLFYIVWTLPVGSEAEPLVFSPYEYEGLDRELTEVPYSLTVTNSTGWSSVIAGAQRIILFTPYTAATGEPGYSNIGIQSVYYGAGERRTSPIVWWEPADPSIDEGIDSVLTPTTSTTAVYDMNGRVCPATTSAQAQTKGVFIAGRRKIVK